MKQRSSSSYKDPLVSSTLKFDLVVILWTAPNYKWVSCSKFVFRNSECTIMCVIESSHVRAPKPCYLCDHTAELTGFSLQSLGCSEHLFLLIVRWQKYSPYLAVSSGFPREFWEDVLSREEGGRECWRQITERPWYMGRTWQFCTWVRCEWWRKAWPRAVCVWEG